MSSTNKLLTIFLFSLLGYGSSQGVNPSLSAEKCGKLGKLTENQQEKFILKCGYFQLPLNYKDSRKIDIFVSIRQPSKKFIKGTIFLNFGGPGGEGANLSKFFPNFSESKNLNRLLEDYRIVSFDPRGIGKSSPISCKPFPENVDPSMVLFSSESQVKKFYKGREKFFLECFKKSPVAQYMSSYFVAKDIDEIRKFLEIEKIGYYGVSYGTHLGNVYATLFPENLRFMVSDSSAYGMTDIKSEQSYADDVLKGVNLYFSECLSIGICKKSDKTKLISKLESLSNRDFVSAALYIQYLYNDATQDGIKDDYENLISPIIHAEGKELSDFLDEIRDSYREESIELENELISCSDKGFLPSEELVISGLKNDGQDLRGRLRTYARSNFYSACSGIPLAPKTQTAIKPIRNIPLLILSGEVDHLTTTAFARLFQKDWGGHLVIAKDAGHGVLMTSQCAAEYMAVFLKNPVVSTKLSHC